MMNEADTQGTRCGDGLRAFTDWLTVGCCCWTVAALPSPTWFTATTLFPPVESRQWLEIRYLDSVPDEVWPAVVFTLVTLLDDPVAADLAVVRSEPVATAWDAAAQLACDRPAALPGGSRCLAIAAAMPTENS